MRRQSKIFLEVDNEGLLTNTLAIIADVVNFDCYESIVSSSQRVIGAYKQTEPHNVTIYRLFYYKRRARSSRMNPVRIRNTTDVFRAVAEHPDGDIPIGVQWSVEMPKKGTVTVKKEPASPPREINTAREKADPKSEGRTRGKHKEKISERESAVPDKRRKIDTTPYKTYMPEGTTVGMPNLVLTPVSSTSPYVTQKYIIENNKTAGTKIKTSTQGTKPTTSLLKDHPNNFLPVRTMIEKGIKPTYINRNTIKVIPKVNPAVTPKVNPQLNAKVSTAPVSIMPKVNPEVTEVIVTPKTKLSSEPKEKVPSTTQYQWPDDIQCELVMTYGGISERQALPVSLTNTVLHMIKDHFHANPLSKLKSDAKKKSNLDSHSQTMIEEMNSAIRERIEEGKKQKMPIKYLQDAKMEVYKTLSQLNLSKARFDTFLDWLKSLHLEEGKQGKFWLSERNRVGSGLKVQYDTDEAAAKKLNQMFRSRVKTNPGKKLHPVDLHSGMGPSGVRPTVPEMTSAIPQQAPLMFLMPSHGVTPGGAQTQLINTSNVQLITTQPVLTNTTTTTVTRPAPNLHPLNPNSKTVYTTSCLPPVETAADSSKEVATRTKKAGPAILRRTKPKLPTNGNDNNGEEGNQDPVPMHLFRSGDEETGSTKVHTYNNDDVPYIKQEPVSYSDADDDSSTLDGTSDFNDTKDPDLSSHGLGNIRHLLNDVKMPQGVEQTEKPFELVTVKTEPLDDY